MARFRSTTPWVTTPALVLITITLNSLTAPSSALPLFFLHNSKPKCFHLEAPEATLLAVHYEAPDITGFKHIKPTTITITQRAPLKRVRDYLPHGPKSKIAPTKKKAKPSIHPLTNHNGKILHRAAHDGELSVCLRSTSATEENPQRFGIQVLSGHDDEHYAHEGTEHHLSKLQTHIMRMNDEVQGVLAEADMAKEREMVYHDQSESMHAGAMYWPVLHVCVLVLVGVTQAGHMIRFFKSKSLI